MLSEISIRRVGIPVILAAMVVALFALLPVLVSATHQSPTAVGILAKEYVTIPTSQGWPGYGDVDLSTYVPKSTWLTNGLDDDGNGVTDEPYSTTDHDGDNPNWIKVTNAIKSEQGNDGPGVCQQLGYDFGGKIEAAAFNGPAGSITAYGTTISLTLNEDGNGHPLIDWQADVEIDVVLVKSAGGYWIYDYAGDANGYDTIGVPANYHDENLYTPHPNEWTNFVVGANLSHLIACWDHSLEVSKTAQTIVDLNHEWGIEKQTSTPDVFAGEDASYTVRVTYIDATAINHRVFVTVTINNPWLEAMTLDSVTDVATTGGVDGQPAAVTCESESVPANSQIVCTYTSNGQSDSDTATAIFTIPAADWHLAYTQSASASATHEWDDATVGTEYDTTVDVSDDKFGPLGSVSLLLGNPVDLRLTGVGGTNGNPTNTFTYDLMPTGGSVDGDTYTNTACINGTPDSGDDSVCDGADVKVWTIGVSKTANTSYDRAWDWKVEKTVAPTSLDLFDGEVANVTWTVTVTRLDPTDSNHAVDGTITVTNNSPLTAKIIDLDDVVSDGLAATLDSGPSIPLNLTTGVKEWTYSRSLPDGAARTNTATATQELNDGSTTTASGDADVVFDPNDPTNKFNEDSVVLDDAEVDVVGQTVAAGSYPYPGTVTCADPSNSASITEDGKPGQSDGNNDATATVVITCHNLTVSKDVNASFDRDWDWGITKNAPTWNPSWDEDPNPVTAPDPMVFNIGGSATINYAVDVSTTGHSDSNWNVSGTIRITNPNTASAAVVKVTDVYDSIPVTDLTPAADVDGNHTVPAGGSLDITYSLDLGSAQAGTNVATADLVGINEPTVAQGTADATFDPNDVDLGGNVTVSGTELVGVVDDNGGTVLPAIASTDDVTGFSDTWTYDIFVSHPGAELCGEGELINTASVVVVGLDINGDPVIVDVANGDPTIIVDFNNAAVTTTHTQDFDYLCPDGQGTYTPGYWKTHSSSHQGGAAYDTTWNDLNTLLGGTYTYDEGDKNLFLASLDLNWYQVLSQPDKGNMWNTLARAYAAAALNVINIGDTHEDLIDVDLENLLGVGWDSTNVMEVAKAMLEDPSSAALGDIIADLNNFLTVPIAQLSDDGNPWTRSEFRNMNWTGSKKDTNPIIGAYIDFFAPMLVLAEYLGAYNNGAEHPNDPTPTEPIAKPGVGPGHADDD